jgi:hypothetical protein
MSANWICIKLGTAACRHIVHVASWMMGAYLAIHPLPPVCAQADCHFVIPMAEFAPGGMFAPATKAPDTGPVAVSASPTWGDVSGTWGDVSGESLLDVGPLMGNLSQGGNLDQGSDEAGPGGTGFSGQTSGDSNSGPDQGGSLTITTLISVVGPSGSVVGPIGSVAVPEPPALPLLGLGLLVLGMVHRRRSA